MPQWFTYGNIFKGKEAGKFQFRSMLALPPFWIMPTYCEMVGEDKKIRFLNIQDENYNDKLELCSDLIFLHVKILQDNFITYIYHDDYDRDNSTIEHAFNTFCLVVETSKIYQWDGTTWNFVKDYVDNDQTGGGGDGKGGKLYIFNNLGRNI